jgi:hypothetical protein
MFDWTVPAEFVVTYETVTDCLAGMTASQSALQYVVDVPKAHEVPDCAEAIVVYSTAFESPVPATVLTMVAVLPATDPTVSVVEVYPPYIAKTRSVSAAVETPVTVGAAAVAVQVLRAVAGSPAAGSNGVVVSAPDTPKAMPEAAVGVPERWTVTVSLVRVVAAVPYHSIIVDCWVPEHEVRVLRADPCQVMLPAESDMDETVTVAPER